MLYPVSETALNQVIRRACDKGIKIFAYDGEVSEPCAYNLHIDQDAAGRGDAEWLVKQLNGKGNIVVITGIAGTSVDTKRKGAAMEVFSKHPDIHVIAEANGQWTQSGARNELTKILATHPRSQINGIWLETGCYTVASMQDEAGIPDDKKIPCAGEGVNGHCCRCCRQGQRSMVPMAHIGPWDIPACPMTLNPTVAHSLSNMRSKFLKVRIFPRTRSCPYLS